VRSNLKGRHRDHCLCYACDRFAPDDREHNCPRANLLYALDVAFTMTTTVWECSAFVDKRDTNYTSMADDQEKKLAGPPTPIVVGGPWEYGGKVWERWKDGGWRGYGFCYRVRNGRIEHSYSGEDWFDVCPAEGYELRAPKDWTPTATNIPEGCALQEPVEPEPTPSSLACRGSWSNFAGSMPGGEHDGRP